MNIITKTLWLSAALTVFTVGAGAFGQQKMFGTDHSAFANEKELYAK
ncbi:hypothetical protein [Chitinophaga barathri]|nr:hypothetical protein [Chitinophaga barathri]